MCASSLLRLSGVRRSFECRWDCGKRMAGRNKFGGGQGIVPSLTQSLDVTIQGVARVA